MPHFLLYGLVQLRPRPLEAPPLLLRALHDPYRLVRAFAADALCAIRTATPEVISALRGALDDPG
jgi:hypothetical protein